MSESLDIRRIRRKDDLPQKSIEATNNKVSVWKTEIKIEKKRVTDVIKEKFYVELSSMLNAGVDMKTALELIKDEQPNKWLVGIFNQIAENIVIGRSLSDAMALSKHFSVYEYKTVEIGEETGQISFVLNQLAIFYKNKIKQYRQIIGAVSYPIVVLVVAIIAVIFMVNYVVPMFSETFKRFGTELPAITKFIVSVSIIFKKYIFAIFLIPIVISFLLYFNRNKTGFEKYFSLVILRIPVVGRLTHKIFLSRFCNIMALLMGAHIPMTQAIALTREMIDFYPLRDSLTKIEEDIVAGTPLHLSLGKHLIYPKKMVSIVKIAEEVNQLDVFFSKLGSQYAEEVDYHSTMLSKFIEPLIIVVLGLVVGVILIAMYLPLFKLGQGF